MASQAHAYPSPAGVEPVTDRKAIDITVKALVGIARDWQLSNADAAVLLDVPSATWSRMKAGTFKGVLDQDKTTRASLLLGIYKSLRLLFNGPLTYGWPTTPNTGPSFGGSTPIAIMTRGGIPALMMVRQHIDALRGGL